jgi:hypothetical protein
MLSATAIDINIGNIINVKDSNNVIDGYKDVSEIPLITKYSNLTTEDIKILETNTTILNADAVKRIALSCSDEKCNDSGRILVDYMINTSASLKFNADSLNILIDNMAILKARMNKNERAIKPAVDNLTYNYGVTNKLLLEIVRDIRELKEQKDRDKKNRREHTRFMVKPTSIKKYLVLQQNVSISYV